MTGRSKRLQALGLLAWLGLVFVAAAAGALASVDAASFYHQLNKPSWAPPASAFGPVWSVLYALMGLSAWLVWREQGKKPVAWALSLFIAQLIAKHFGPGCSSHGAWAWLRLATSCFFWSSSSSPSQRFSESIVSRHCSWFHISRGFVSRRPSLGRCGKLVQLSSVKRCRHVA